METVQRRLIRPKKLVHVAPFNVVLLWSNGEIRLNDFATKVENWRVGDNKLLARLANPAVFMSAMIHDNTLAFNKIKLRIPGVSGTQPLDLDSDVLFKESVRLGRIVANKDLVKSHRANRTKREPKFKITITDEGISERISYYLPTARHLIQVDGDLIEIDN